MGESPFTGEPGTSSAAGGTWGNSGDTPTEQGERWEIYFCVNCNRPTTICRCDGNLGHRAKIKVVPASALTEAEQRFDRMADTANLMATRADEAEHRAERAEARVRELEAGIEAHLAAWDTGDGVDEGRTRAELRALLPFEREDG